MHAYDVLGPLRVDGDADSAPRRPAQRRVLSLLLLERHEPVSRDLLIDRMWPDGAPAGAVNTLQVHVSGLRRLLGAGAVTADARGYRLVLSEGSVDADRFTDLVQSARAMRTDGRDEDALDACDAAVALWRGAPFPELSDDACAAPEIERLHEAWTAVRSLRAAAQLDLGRWHEAAEALELLVGEHPHRERLWEMLMLAHYRAGRSADALLAYQGARTALGELGLDPGHSLRDLERRMLVQDPALASPAPRRPVGPATAARPATVEHGVHAWPLVARDAEVARLADVVAGRTRGAVLVGPAGVGKSRLLHEAARRAPPAAPTVVLRGNASLAHVPLGPVSDLARLAPGPVAAQLDQLLDAMRSMSAGRPPLVLVDDAHHLDDTTLGLLERALETDTVRLVATVRNDRPVPSPITRWWKDLGLDRVAVAPLSQEAFATLLDRVLGAMTPATRDRFVAVAGGNPLHLREMIRAAHEEGALVHVDGRWDLVRPVVGSDRLGELVDLVLRGLSRRSRHGLEVLAVARPAPREVMEEVAGVAAVDELQAAGLVRLDADDEQGVLVDSAHPLYVENLAARMDDDRRRALGRDVVTSWERLGVSGHGVLLQVATLALEVGCLSGSLALDASREAMVRMDAALALRLADAAVTAEGSAEAWLLQGRAYALLGEHDRAETAFGRASRLATPEQLGEIDSQRAASLAFGRREPARAVAVLDDVLRTRPADDPVAARLRIERSLYLAMSGRMVEVLDEVAALQDLSLPPPAVLIAGLGDTLARAMLGRLDGLDERLDEHEDRARQLQSEFPLARDQLDSNRVQGLLLAGRTDRAEQVVAAWGDRVRAGEGLHSLWSMMRLFVLEHQGRIADALDVDAAEADAFAAGPDPFRLGLLLPGYRAILLGQAGRLAEARQHLHAVDPDSLRSDARNMAMWRHGNAWCQLPDRDRAASAFAEAGRLAVAQGHAAWGVHAWYGAVRMGRPDLAVAGLRSTLDDMEGADAVASLLASATAHLAGDPRAMVGAAEGFVGHGMRLLAAEAYSAASQCAADRDDHVLAGMARRAAVDLAHDLGARTPALAALDLDSGSRGHP